MSNQKLQSDSVAGLRYRGSSLGLPSVSRFRSGHMPSGMDVSRVIDNLSESDMDTSDSESERYGARYSLEASPQDDKVPNGGARHNAFVNARSGIANSPGNYTDRQGGRGGGFSAAHRDFVYDESSESVTSSEVNSTPPRSNNGNLLEKKYNPGANPSGTSMRPNMTTVKQVRAFRRASSCNLQCCAVAVRRVYLERIINHSTVFWMMELILVSPLVLMILILFSSALIFFVIF